MMSICQDTTVVYCDCQSAMHLVKNQGNHGKTKPVNIRFHFVREVTMKK